MPIPFVMSRCAALLRVLTPILLTSFIGACASTGSAPRPFPVPNPTEATAGAPDQARPSAVDGYALVGTALDLRGAPYRNGGADPQGFDCSGFTQYVFARFGVALPREVRDQFGIGQRVSSDEWEPGDLLFFSTTAPGPSHVGIAIGGDQFVHAPSSNGVVRVERISSSYWASRYIGARRVP